VTDQRMQVDELIKAGLAYFRGRVALAAILRSCGVGPGDSVAIPGYSCSAVAEAVLFMGARPIFVDIDFSTYNVTAANLSAAIEPTTKAIVVQHTFGIPADCTALAKIAATRGITMIEDCCHTIDSRWAGRAVGSYGAAAFYSFEFGKVMSTGLGGLAIAHDTAIKERLGDLHKRLRSPSVSTQGRLLALAAGASLFARPRFYWMAKRTYSLLKRSGFAPDVNFAVGELQTRARQEYAWRMGRIQSDMLKAAVKRYSGRASRRREVAGWYAEALGSTRSAKPQLPEEAEAVYLRYPVRVRNKAEVLQRAHQAGIALSDNFASPVHPYAGDELRQWGYRLGSCPEGEQAGREVICLPIGLGIGREQAYSIVRYLEPWLL
jgi:dTDP-4-amino-4,6-dideoxygalactose transaminase